MRNRTPRADVAFDGYVVRYVSFAWTTKALFHGKTVTRRHWNDNWARRWEKGDYAVAYDRNPMYGGSQVALIQLTEAPYKENTADIPDEDWVNEGFEYLESIGEKVNGKTPREFWDAWKAEAEDIWVIRFEVVLENVPDIDPKTGVHAFRGDADLCALCDMDARSPWHERAG